MPEGFFDPLPEKNFNGDRMKQWLRQQTISAQKFVGGEIQAIDIVLGSGGTIESSDFVSGSAGWQIDGDGNAEFNDVTVRGTLVAGPANDSITIDHESDKYRLVDAGTDIFANAVIEFDQDWSVSGITTNAAISVYDGQSLANPYIFMAGPHRGTDLGDAARVSMGIREGSFETLGFVFAEEVTLGWTSTGGFVKVENSQIRAPDGSASAPTYSFTSDTDTGMFRKTANQIGWAVGGTEVWSSDANRFTLETFLNLSRSTLTISSGAVTATKSFHFIDTQGGDPTDDLSVINGGSDGDLLILMSATSSRDPTLKDGTGNLALAGDFTLSTSSDSITLINRGGSSWVELSRSDNA